VIQPGKHRLTSDEPTHRLAQSTRPNVDYERVWLSCLRGTLRRCLFRGLGGASQAGANQEGCRMPISIRSVDLWSYCTMSYQPPLKNKQSQGSAFTRSNGSFEIPTARDNGNTPASVVPERHSWTGRCGERIPSHRIGRAPMRGRRGGKEPAVKREWESFSGPDAVIGSLR
jgi:hypothetical protein